MSLGAPDIRRTPHRLTLPVTVVAFLAPWVASGWIPPERPTLVPPPATIAAPEPEPEVLALVEQSEPVTAAEAVLVAPADPLAQGAPAATELDETSRTGHAALARISWPWQTVLAGWEIAFVPADRSTHGVTNPATQRIEVGVPSGATVFDVARVLAHEIGHAADLTLNDTSARRAWKAQRSIGADTAWWPSGSGNDFSTGAGDFAECFAEWQLGIRGLSAWGPCSAADLDFLGSLVGEQAP